MSRYTIAHETSPDPADVRAVHEGLDAFNLAHAPPTNFEPLTLLVRDEGGAVAGGLIGATYWGWLYVEVLWLAEEARGEGRGSALLAAAEQVARERGCRHAHLDTMDWQALPFYQRQGYTLWGQLDGYAGGHTRYFLRKVLAP